MTEEFDREMRVNFACVVMIICCVVEMFLIIIRFTVVEAAQTGVEGLILTLISSGFTVLTMALTYLIVKGSTITWWFLMIAFIIYAPISVYYTFQDPIYCLELILVCIYIILLATPALRVHCNIHLKRSAEPQ